MSNFKYDINAKFNSGMEYSLKDLQDEILRTNKKLDPDKSNDLSYYFEKNKKSSLLKKLIDLLDFDMVSICGNNKEETFDMLKILYLLYDIEKSGEPRKRADYQLNEKRVLITNLLANHSFENIKSIFSSNSIFGEVFNELYDDIRSQVNDAEDRIQVYENANEIWYKLAHLYFDKYVISAEAVFHPKSALKDIDRIYHYLKEEILDKLQNASPHTLKYKDGVMKSFFNILNSHELMCYNLEKTRINNQYSLNHVLPALYIELNRNSSQLYISWELLPYMKKNIENITDSIATINIYSFGEIALNTIKNIDTYTKLGIKAMLFELKKLVMNSDLATINRSLDYLINNLEKLSKTKIKKNLVEIVKTLEAVQILWFVSEFKGISKEDYTHYKYALRNIKKFSEIFLITRELDFTKGINHDLFLGIMQEIIVVKKNKLKVANIYYGRKNTYKYLRKSLTTINKSDAVVNLAWLSRIENRIAINYGQAEHVNQIRKIENLLYDIKRIIFEYRNIDDLHKVNDFIFYLADRAIVPNEEAELCKSFFDHYFKNYLKDNNLNLKILEKPQNESVLDFFREIHRFGSTTYCQIFEELSKIILDYFNSKTDDQKRIFYVPISIDRVTSILSFTLDLRKGIMKYVDYQPYIPKKELKDLNLKNFIYEEYIKTKLFKADFSKN